MSFWKRVWESRKKIFIYGGGGLVAFLVFLSGLSQYGVSIETSGDIRCAGTATQPCESFINISLEDYSVCFGSTFKGVYFDDDDALQSWQLWKTIDQESGRQYCTYGRTYLLWEHIKDDLYYCPSSSKQGKVETKYQRCDKLSSTGKMCYRTGGRVDLPYDNDFAGRCMASGQTHEFRLEGYKNDPYDTVKWGVGYGNKDEDPLWLGHSKVNFDVTQRRFEIKSKDFLGKYLEWSFTDINETYYLATFEIETDVLNDIKEAIPYDNSDYRWKDLRDKYFDGNTIDKTADNLKDLEKFPLISLSDEDLKTRGSDIPTTSIPSTVPNMEFSNYKINMKEGWGSFNINFPRGWQNGLLASFGFGSTTVATSTDEGMGGGDTSWNHRVFWDNNNERWHIVYIDADSDIHTASSADGTTWADGTDVDAGTYDYEDFDCVRDYDGASTYLHCAYSSGTLDYVNYRRMTLTGNVPYIIAGTEEEPFDASDMGENFADDVALPRIGIDSNHCVHIFVDFEDDSDPGYGDEHELALFKEAVCGNGDWDNNDMDADFPIWDIQIGPGTRYEMPHGIERYNDTDDFQLMWMDTNITGGMQLNSTFYEGSTETIGTYINLSADIEGNTAAAQFYAINDQNNITVFGLDDNTQDLDAYIMEGPNPSTFVKVDTGLNMYDTSYYSQPLTAVIDYNSSNNHTWVFATYSGDDEDIYYANTTDKGETWSAPELWIDEGAVAEVKFLDADITPCGVILVSWLANSTSPWTIETETIRTPSCPYVDVTPPTFSSTTADETKIGATVNFSTLVEDTDELDFWIFETNNTGTFINHTWNDISGASATLSNITTLNDTLGAVVNYSFYANDTSNNWARVTGQLTTTDGKAPTYDLNSTNDTGAGNAVNHSLNWTDDVGLDSYIFQFCNGTWDGSDCKSDSVVANWFNSTFDKCVEVEIMNVNGKEVLKNYPQLINVTKHADMLSTYEDLRFVDTGCANGGNELNYDINDYNSNYANIWVQMDLGTGNTTISYYFHNLSVVEAGEEQNATWDSGDDENNYLAVWHFEEENGQEKRIDATKWDNVLTPFAIDDGDDVPAVIGKGIDLDGSAEYLYMPDGTYLNISNRNITLEAWFNTDATATTFYQIMSKNVYPKGYALFQYGTSLYIEINSDGSSQASKGTVNTNNYFYGVGIYNSTSIAYLNAEAGTPTAYDKDVNGSGYALQVGRWAGTGYHFNGILDELRISNTSRSESELNQTFMTIRYHSQYVSYGDVEIGGYDTGWENDTAMAFVGTWSNTTKVINSTTGAVVAWCYYANDTSNNWNGTSCLNPFYYTITSVGAPEINATYGPPETLKLQWGENSTGHGCGPDNTSVLVEPKNQTTSGGGIFYYCNSGNQAGDVSIALTGAATSPWKAIMASIDNSSSPANLVNLSTSPQVIKSDMGADTCLYTWMFANCTAADINPGVSVDITIA